MKRGEGERERSKIYLFVGHFFANSSKIELLQMSQNKIDKDKMAKRTTKLSLITFFPPFN